MKFVMLCDFALIMLAITPTTFMVITNLVFGQGKVVEGQGKVRDFDSSELVGTLI